MQNFLDVPRSCVPHFFLFSHLNISIIAPLRKKSKHGFIQECTASSAQVMPAAMTKPAQLI
jgi:hypothetical protein